MFIEKRIIVSFAPSVRYVKQKRWTYRTDGAKEIENIGYYKHIVPTGLKSISHI